MSLMIPVSWGELLDKLTILQIKQKRMDNKEKLKNITNELMMLCKVRDAQGVGGSELDGLITELHRVNEVLWDIEDEIRVCEKEGDFGNRFVKLARSVYQTNDRRAGLKYQINTLLGSDLVEEKSYEAY